MKTSLGTSAVASGLLAGLCLVLGMAEAVRAATDGTFDVYVDASSSATSPDGSSWAQAFPSLADALAFANSSTTSRHPVVKVAAGIYRHPGSQSALAFSFKIARAMTVVGGFPPGGGDAPTPDPSLTVLSGDALGNDSEGTPDSKADNHRCLHVVNAEACEIRNLTIEGGHALGAINAMGGGVLVEGGSLDLSDCVIQSCEVDIGGGIASIDASLSLQRCNVSNNNTIHSGAGLSVQGGALVISESHIGDNTIATYGVGGGVSITNTASVSILRSVLEHNFAANGGAISLSAGQAFGSFSIQVVQSRLSLNEAGSTGGCIFADADSGEGTRLFSLIDCQVDRNYAHADGGFLRAGQLDFVIRGCTLVDNSSLSGGGCVSYSGSAFTCDVSNSIVYGKVGATASVSQFHPWTAQSVDISYSDVEDLPAVMPAWVHDGCVDVDPQFEVQVGEDPCALDGYLYALTELSPCIDAGEPGFDSFDPTINFAPRWVDGDIDGETIVDLGSFEYTPLHLQVADEDAGPTLTGSCDAPLAVVFLLASPTIAPTYAPSLATTLLLDPAVDAVRLGVPTFPFSVDLSRNEGGSKPLGNEYVQLIGLTASGGEWISSNVVRAPVSP